MNADEAPRSPLRRMASALEDPQSPVRKLTRAATEVVFGKAKSIRATVMQLTTCTLGAGILTLPFALSCFGLGLGLITLVFNSAFALLCSFFLSMACTSRALHSYALPRCRPHRAALRSRCTPAPDSARTGTLSGEYSYGGLARAAGGEAMALVVDFLILCVLLMVMAGGIDALGDSLGQVVVEIFGNGCDLISGGGSAPGGANATELVSLFGGNTTGAAIYPSGWCAWAHGAKLIGATTAEVTGVVGVAPTLIGRLALTAAATFGVLLPLSLVPVAALRYSSSFSVVALVLIVVFIVSRGAAAIASPPASASGGGPEHSPWRLTNLFKFDFNILHGISLVAFAFANQIQIPMFQLDLEPVPIAALAPTPVASPKMSGARDSKKRPLLAHDDFADVSTPPSAPPAAAPRAPPSLALSILARGSRGDLDGVPASAVERDELRDALDARRGSGQKMKLVMAITSGTLTVLFCCIAAFGLISAGNATVADDILQQYGRADGTTVILLTAITRALMCLCVLCSFPLQVAPAREALVVLSSKLVTCVRASRGGALAAPSLLAAGRKPSASRLSAHSDAAFREPRDNVDVDGDGFTADDRSARRTATVVHVVATIAITVLAFALSTAASKLSEVFGLAGASCGAILLYVLPCVFYATFASRTERVLGRNGASARRKAAIAVASLCALLGAVVGAVCTCYIIYGIVQDKLHPTDGK